MVNYAAPALEKGLDIIELLADASGSLSQSEIADATGRSVGQIFRVLDVLERRGYILRDRQSGLCAFSMMAFDLAHRHDPLRGLVAASVTPMRELADKVQQSCNLSVLDAGRVRMIAQAESPADFGFRVRVGAVFPVESTGQGEVLTSGEVVVRTYVLEHGITDVVAPVTDARGRTVAALTVPFLATSFSTISVDEVVAEAVATSGYISRHLQGEPS